jgi:hypothetical protein
MKYSLCIFFIFVFLACSSTKSTVYEKSAKTIQNLKTAQDTLIHDTISMEKEVGLNSEIDSRIRESNEFNQKLIKRSFEQHELWDNLLEKHVSNEGKVNYTEFKKDHKNLLEYIKFLQLYKPLENASRNQALAYWINAYNAMTIDLILRHYPIKSIKDIKDPWDQRLWKLGNKWYNLNEIEHKVLRKMDEPRMHFAIVCASISCPKLSNQAYTSENLEQQLTQATIDFLSDSSKNVITSENLALSKIFQWFTKDFTQNGSLIDFLNQYSEIEILRNAKKTFNDYNWNLNE